MLCAALMLVLAGCTNSDKASAPKRITVASAEETDISTQAENINIQNTIQKLHTSTILSDLESEGHVKIIGAKYDIKDGSDEFLE